MYRLRVPIARWSLSLTGLLLTLIPVGHVLVEPHSEVAPMLLEGMLPVAILGLVVAVGGWLAVTESAAFVALVTRWTLAGVGGMLVATVWVLLLLSIRGVPVEETAILTLSTLPIGALMGCVLGLDDARNRRVSSELDAERDRLALLNELLRHNVLNAMQVVLGRADLLYEETGSDHAATILRWGNTVTRQVQELRLLIDTEGDPEPTALAPVVRSEAEEFADRDGDDVDVAVDVPEVAVLADDALGALVESLLLSARERAAGPLSIRIDGDADGERVTLSVTDDGPALPAAQREALDAPDDADPGVFGFGLFLVRVLAERYGGEVAAGEGGEGVRVTFRRARGSPFGNP